jgi:hypothetical protein
LLALPRLSPAAREERIRTIIRLWFRPAHLHRRVLALEKRTAFPAQLNTCVLTGLVVLSIYVVFDVAAHLPDPWSGRVAEMIPWLVLGLMAIHVAAVVSAWRAKRHLRPLTPEKRGAALFSALLLPPQALRLRALLSDGYFPVQHPLAMILEFCHGKQRREAYAFNALADLHWPAGRLETSPLAREVAAWFRKTLEPLLMAQLAKAGIETATLLAAPQSDSPASCSYCPRCRDQFSSREGTCPNGVTLCPLPRQSGKFINPATHSTSVVPRR